jgi:hypothetical protein
MGPNGWPCLNSKLRLAVSRSDAESDATHLERRPVIETTIVAVVSVRPPRPTWLLADQRELGVYDANCRHSVLTEKGGRSRVPVLSLRQAQLEVPARNHSDLVNRPRLSLLRLFLCCAAFVHRDMERGRERHIRAHTSVVS